MSSKKPPRPPIPKALREQVWLKHAGRRFEIKCPTKWCRNKINSFDFHIGHNIPFSKGGTLELNNLRPICSRCNTSMSDNYNFKTWDNLGSTNKSKSETKVKPSASVVTLVSLKPKPEIITPTIPKVPPIDLSYYNNTKPKVRTTGVKKNIGINPSIPIIPNTIGNVYETKKENKLSKFISNILDKFI